MSVNSKMTAIADKIRSLLGLTGTMGLDAMATNLGTAQTTVDSQADLLDEALTAIAGKASGSGAVADPVLEELTITANGTYTPDSGVDGFSKVIANIPTSGTDNSSAILDKSVTEINNSEVTSLGTYVLRECKSLVSVSFAAVKSIASYVFYNCTALVSVYFPALESISSYAFRGCTALEVLDFPALESISTNAFYGCTKLSVLVLRSDTVCSLSGTNAFTNTPFASNGSGGTVYVPSALIASYQAANNWSSLAVTFKAIEGSEYE